MLSEHRVSFLDNAPCTNVFIEKPDYEMMREVMHQLSYRQTLISYYQNEQQNNTQIIFNF